MSLKQRENALKTLQKRQLIINELQTPKIRTSGVATTDVLRFNFGRPKFS